MTPTGDLDTPEEVGEFIRGFYADVAQDDVLGPMFNDVAQVDWSAHVPKLTAFWCRVLFGHEGYVGDPFATHARIHAKERFTAAQFYRWLELFTENLQSGWSGPYTDRMNLMAKNVAQAHSHRLLGEPIEVELDPFTIISRQ